MKSTQGVGPSDVTAVYSGPQADLFTLLMGQQLHLGGMNSSLDLAERAGIGEGRKGIDLRCGVGGGMRVLLRFRNVASMIGIDTTQRNIECAKATCREEGFGERLTFLLADAVTTGLPSGSSDFVWGEDAWCYVAEKGKLIAEAARLVKPGGIIAFTDWLEDPEPLSDAEAERFLHIMSFANVEDIRGYCRLLADHDCKVIEAEDTRRLPRRSNCR